jgi:hypothetical protein
MTRFHSLTVVLEQDIPEDAAEGIMEAIKHIRHVISAVPHVADIESHMAEERAKQNLKKKLWEALKD